MSALENVEIAELLSGALDEDYDAEYDRYLESLPEEPGELVVDEAPGLFQVTDPLRAEWALRHIGRSQRLLAEADETARRQIEAVMSRAEELLAPVRERRAAEHAKHEQDIAFMSQLLQTFHRKLLADDPKRKTIKLAFGTLSSRQGQPHYTFSPEFVEWARAAAPDLVRTKYETDANAAKAVLALVENADGELAATFDGELVPGVEVEPAEVSFKVEAS
jgi:phage host-nuclease inhibitor protein Gam